MVIVPSRLIAVGSIRDSGTFQRALVTQRAIIVRRCRMPGPFDCPSTRFARRVQATRAPRLRMPFAATGSLLGRRSVWLLPPSVGTYPHATTCNANTGGGAAVPLRLHRGWMLME